MDQCLHHPSQKETEGPARCPDNMCCAGSVCECRMCQEPDWFQHKLLHPKRSLNYICHPGAWPGHKHFVCWRYVSSLAEACVPHNHMERRRRLEVAEGNLHVPILREQQHLPFMHSFQNRPHCVLHTVRCQCRVATRPSNPSGFGDDVTLHIFVNLCLGERFPCSDVGDHPRSEGLERS
jgi:hypothetical protein